jgi:hypothetical protein
MCAADFCGARGCELMKTEGDYVILEEEEVIQLGPYSSAKALRLGDSAPFITRVIAWCYADWNAQQRADDDGWAPRWP